MRLTSILLWIVLFFIFIDLLSYLRQSIPGIQAGGTSAVIWLCKMLLIISYLIIGILLYKLQIRFTRIGYLDLGSARLLRNLGWISLYIAILASVQNAAQVIRSVTYDSLRFHEYIYIAVRAFAAHLLVRTPTQMLFALFLFLFADFVKRADAVKRENESFI